MDSPTRPRRSGTWVVIGLLLIAAVATLIAYTYWNNYVTVAPADDAAAPAQPA